MAFLYAMQMLWGFFIATYAAFSLTSRTFVGFNARLTQWKILDGHPLYIESHLVSRSSSNERSLFFKHFFIAPCVFLRFVDWLSY
jgi:hypothetical protein